MTRRLSAVHAIVLLVFSVLISACSTSRYSMEHDAAPPGSFDASRVPDVVPRWEPLSRKGNKSPYVIRGKTYRIIDSAHGFEQQGVASWYGLKFHGELTSNGEIYNMYEMSAAHKTLPLPSYVRVINLDNQRSVVVRVNDRGPFHDDRVIDLSYAAAIKLGYADKGTANVKLEALVVANNDQQPGVDGEAKLPLVNDRLAQFVQIAAYSNAASAQATKAVIEKQLKQPAASGTGDSESKVFVAVSPELSPPIYRVRVGPLQNIKQAEAVLDLIKKSGVGQPMLITRAISAKDH